MKGRGQTVIIGATKRPNTIDAAQLEKALLECVEAVVRQRPTILSPILEMWRCLFKVATQMLETGKFQDVEMDVTPAMSIVDTAHLRQAVWCELQVLLASSSQETFVYSAQTRSILGAKTGRCQFGTFAPRVDLKVIS